jgi:hypothetical protein
MKLQTWIGIASLIFLFPILMMYGCVACGNLAMFHTNQAINNIVHRAAPTPLNDATVSLMSGFTWVNRRNIHFKYVYPSDSSTWKGYILFRNAQGWGWLRPANAQDLAWMRANGMR